MGNLDFSANADQLKELAAYMASQINVPTIGIGGGYAPLGTINFFDATVAPQDWLACDGSVYNIADYPQLAEWYATQHGASNFYGGDGTTTFAVPNLQGEFLRGTGTNSHANQGSGAAVGEHQNGTTVPLIYSALSSNKPRIGWGGASEILNFENTEGSIPTTVKLSSYTGADTTAVINDAYGKVRPTNTSFLICVKAVVAGEVYSTEERVVGTWIDGKKIYQKTFNLSWGSMTISSNDNRNVAHGINVETPIKASIIYKSNGAWIVGSPLGSLATIYSVGTHFDTTLINVTCGSTMISRLTDLMVTLQYTKTTD